MIESFINILKSKLTMVIIVSIVIIGIVWIFLCMDSTINTLNKKVNTYKNNEKALIAENDSLKNQAIVYQITVDQLSYFNDSISLKLQKAVKELDIQRKNLRQLQYIKSVTAVDTLFIEHKDTIFVSPKFHLDTLITDNKWYSVYLGLQYPNLISIKPQFTNEFIVVTTAKKECVDTPKKFFLARWFQKKHTVLETVVTDNNPYSEVKNNRFINIVK